MATQRDTAERTLGSSSRVAPKKINAPDRGLTMENNAPNASKNVAKPDPSVGSPRGLSCRYAANLVQLNRHSTGSVRRFVGTAPEGPADAGDRAGAPMRTDPRATGGPRSRESRRWRDSRCAQPWREARGAGR